MEIKVLKQKEEKLKVHITVWYQEDTEKAHWKTQSVPVHAEAGIENGDVEKQH